MTPEQKIQHAIMLKDAPNNEVPLPEITAENIGEVWDARSAEWALQDAIAEFREGEIETPDIEAESSRHYETKAVAAKMPDGSWVGWTYWFGGGKHGNPEEIDWMPEAYELKVTGEKVVTVLTFEKVEAD